MNQANELVQSNRPEAPVPMKQFVPDISTTLKAICLNQGP
jgi:hypothetical protein